MDDDVKYYGAVEVDREDNDNALIAAGSSILDSQQTDQVCADCTVSITPNRLDTSGPDIFVVSEVDNRLLPINIVNSTDNNDLMPTEATWFTVREIDGPNTAVFSATNLADESILGISDAEDVRRGASAIITYDDDDTDVNVQHSEATIEIQSPDDVWTSGLAIPIVIVDGDVNKNSRDSNDVDLTDPDSIIPTLVTGDPFTLGETSSNLVTWLGWYIAENDVTDATTLLNRVALDP